MMMDRRSSKAIIVIGDTWSVYYCTNDHDIYYYPEDVTEWELAEEISNLKEFYDEIIWPIYWPPHLREEKVKAWINGQQ